jgi:membrane protease YdiL (CAAX protease family)
METQLHISRWVKGNPKLALLHWANLLYLLIFAASILIAVHPAGSPRGGLPGGLDPAVMMIVAQFGGVLIPGLLFIWLTRQPILTTLKLRRLSFSSGVKCFLIGLLCWPIFIVLGNLSTILLALINPQAGATPNIVTGGGSPWIAFLGIALVAPVFEELLFRGVLLSAYEGCVGSHAIWLVAILFGFYHFSLDNLVGPLILGLIVGWLIYRTRSIWAGVLTHMGVNLLGGLFILLNALTVPAGAEAAAQNTATLTPDVIWLGVMIWGGVSLVFSVPIFFLLRSISQRYPVPEQPASRLSLRTTWSTIAVSLGAVAYFGAQLLSLMRQ